MANEILAVPEENLKETIRVIRIGLSVIMESGNPVSTDTEEGLLGWCRDEEEYLERLSEKE
jgi:hypothetical protein